MRFALHELAFGAISSVLVCACDAKQEEVLAPQDDSGWLSLTERTCPKNSELNYESFGEPFFLAWCTGCHSSSLSGDQRANAPLGMDFDTLAQVRAHADRIWARAGDKNVTMPPAGGPPASAREELGEWLACGAPSTQLFDGGTSRVATPDGGQMPSDAGPEESMPVFSSTGEYATPITDNQAFCGGTTCNPGTSACCVRPDTPPECTSTTDNCDVVIGCDGPEDCSGDACCFMPSQTGARLSCAASCGEMSAIVCHSAAQCPADRPACCSHGAPFGHCTTMAAAGLGERCDVP